MDEVRKAVQGEMWAQHGEAEIRTRFLEAEAACDSSWEPHVLQAPGASDETHPRSKCKPSRLGNMDPATGGTPEKQSGDPQIG